MIHNINTNPILALETSSDICSAAIIRDENTFSEINLKIKNIHSEKLLEIIKQLLEINNLELSNLSSIAVSSGPGSFTGLRIGMSAAKGLAIGANLPIISVPTFEALALQISFFIPIEKQFILATRVNVDEIYYAKFIKTNGSYDFVDELQVISRDKLKNNLDKDTLIFGNAVSTDSNYNIRQISAPNAVYVGKWAYLFGKDLLNYNFDFLEPNYLKNFVVKIKGV